jgi:AmmeMemoRadiSam system protein B/AmmeMemoRadiSam system protein A
VPKRVRSAVLAGSWYDAEPETLRRNTQALLDAAVLPAEQPTPQALIVPHAGHKWSGPTAAIAYKSILGLRYQTVIVLAPNHRRALVGAAIPGVDALSTPLGEVPIDTSAAQTLLDAGAVVRDDEVHAQEHAIEIQLPFLQLALQPGFSVLPILVGDGSVPSLQRLARHLRPLLGPETLLVISTDFTHYGERFGYLPFVEDVPRRLEELDLGAFDAVATLDPWRWRKYRDDTGITVCGAAPLTVFAALAAEPSGLRRLAYQNSGEQAKSQIDKNSGEQAKRQIDKNSGEQAKRQIDKNSGEQAKSQIDKNSGEQAKRQIDKNPNTVSYLAAAYAGPWRGHEELLPQLTIQGTHPLTQGEAQVAVALARDALETRLLGMRESQKEVNWGLTLAPVFSRRLGVFVTLKRHGELRGCIGNVLPRQSLGEAIVGRALDAAFSDHRFAPVSAWELPQLELEVSVLSTPEPMADWSQIEIGRHGIILSKGELGALFLPQVAPEQGWTLEQTLSQLARKAGLPAEGWREGASFEVFEAQVLHERFAVEP